MAGGAHGPEQLMAPPKQVNPKKRKAPSCEFAVPHLMPGTRAAKRRQTSSVHDLIHMLQVERAQRHAAKAEKDMAQKRQRAKKCNSVFRTELACAEQVPTDEIMIDTSSNELRPPVEDMNGFAEYHKQLSRIHVRKYYSRDQVAFAIYLRFGSLTEDTNVMHSFSDIRYMTGISQPSMVRIIKKWRSLDKDINRYPAKLTRNRWPLTPEMEQWAVSPQVL